MSTYVPRWHTVSTGGTSTADVALIAAHVAVSTDNGVGLYTVDAWEDGGDPIVWAEGATNRDEHAIVWCAMLAGDGSSVTTMGEYGAPVVLTCGECMRGEYYPDVVRVGHNVATASTATCTLCRHVVHASDITNAMDAGRLYWTTPVAWLSADELPIGERPDVTTFETLEAAVTLAYDALMRHGERTAADTLTDALEAVRDAL